MKNINKLKIFGIFSLILCFSFGVFPQDKKGNNKVHKNVHWSYEGSTGPVHWGELSPEFSGCSGGKSQSPVNLKDATLAKLSRLAFSYEPQTLHIINNGHTIQVNFSKGDTVIIDGEKYSLLQFHFHTPSEHTVNGKHYPMEVHFVNVNSKGQLGVIGLFFTEGNENQELNKIINNLPDSINREKTKKNVDINPLGFFPYDMGFYRYYGSLTTPPCSEGVKWTVIKIPVEASKQQLDKMKKIMGENNRPVQPVNHRFILRSE